jgi:hypothetical protein
MDNLGGKFGLLYPSFSLTAMVMVIVGKPVQSPFVWIAFALILALLVGMNARCSKLYQKAKALAEDPRAPRT